MGSFTLAGDVLKEGSNKLGICWAIENQHVCSICQASNKALQKYHKHTKKHVEAVGTMCEVEAKC